MAAAGLTQPPIAPVGEAPWFGRPFNMPLGVTAQKIMDADDSRLGLYVYANAPSQGAVGEASAPAITTNVCSINNLAPGVYDVTSTVAFVGGTAVAGQPDSTNWRLVLGKASAGTGQTVATLSCPIANNQPQSRNIRVTAPGGQDLFLASVVAPTASVLYQGDLAAIPLTPVYIGVDPQVTGTPQGYTGWPVGPTVQFLPCNQELWGIAPVSGAAGNLPAVLYVWEVRRFNAPFAQRPYEGD